MSKPPLSRFRVIDVAHVRAGPTCVRQLADWGADVIKVEAPGPDKELGGDRHGSDFQNIHRNKRSMTLDLKKPEGLEIMKRLVKWADVFVENNRPDVKFRLGIDYESLKKVNPRLVYASISGFGQDGPYRERPGLDQIAQGMGGLMSITGLPGQCPVRTGIPIADLAAGIFAAMGILVALWEREESGEGQWVQSSLLAAQISMLDFQAARWTIDHKVPPQAGNDHPTAVPTGLFPTRDGHINIAVTGDEIYRRLCRALGADRLADEPDFANARARYYNRQKVNAEIEVLLLQKTSSEWIEIFHAAGVPCGPVYQMDEVFADPQVKHMGIVQSVMHPALGPLDLIGQPVILSRTPSRLVSATPERGEHTVAVLNSLGYDDVVIARLKESGVI